MVLSQRGLAQLLDLAADGHIALDAIRLHAQGVRLRGGLLQRPRPSAFARLQRTRGKHQVDAVARQPDRDLLSNSRLAPVTIATLASALMWTSLRLRCADALVQFGADENPPVPTAKPGTFRTGSTANNPIPFVPLLEAPAYLR